jgi:transcriptional regulator with XRE-family HTH domain
MQKLIFFPYMAKSTENCPNRIREWRQRKNITLVQLAREIGATHGHLQKMEVGDRPVTLEWLDRISEKLGVSVGELLHERQNPLLPTVDEQKLLTRLREGGDQLMRMAQALADAHRSYTPPTPDPPANDAGKAGDTA